jgi:glycine betaine/proline transport system permease protein
MVLRPRFSGPDFGWLTVGFWAVLILALASRFSWLEAYPSEWVVPLAVFINRLMDFVVEQTQFVTRLIAGIVGAPMEGVRWLLLTTPWAIVSAFFVCIAHYAGGAKLALFTATAMIYMLVTRYWDASINTLALVGVAVFFAVALGFALGLIAYKRPSFDRVLQAAADMMQTIPAFAYLIPVLLLFGFGATAGLIASVIYATPPIMRNTVLGLSRVPAELSEAAEMSGCSPLQSLIMVKLPSAARQIMVGVNQTTMAAFSMVIIAATIGGSDDIGWAVLNSLRKADFGESLLAGIVIVQMAMIMDRITSGWMARRRNEIASGRSEDRRGVLFIHCGILCAVVLACLIFPALREYPDAWTYKPVKGINDWLNSFISHYGYIADWIKQTSFYYLLLPLRIGFSQAATPYTWGFQMTPAIMIQYWVAAVALVGIVGLRFGHGAATAVGVASWVFFFGTTGIAWPTFMAAIGYLAYRSGGVKLSAFALFVMGFILVNGFWEPAMMSLYLCGTAVVSCFIVGGVIGIWAASNDAVSAIVRPIGNTLQTMPQFVLLIPALMLFQVGEFTALIAIVLYAIVPPIIYVEHGLRTVPRDLIEAATQIGVSPWQMLFDVKIPAARPIILLGLNQTIMFGLAMLVITALVGTRDLGQEVYVGLSQADAGKGLIAGMSIAMIAMLSERIISASASSEHRPS